MFYNKGFGGIGGGIYSSGSLSIIGSTISANAAANAIDMPYDQRAQYGYHTPSNAGVGGGIAISGAANPTTTATAIDCIFQNVQGGNIAELAVSPGLDIVELPVAVAFRSLGHNLFSDNPGLTLDPTDLISTDPLLGPLANNGGPT